FQPCVIESPRKRTPTSPFLASSTNPSCCLTQAPGRGSGAIAVLAGFGGSSNARAETANAITTRGDNQRRRGDRAVGMAVLDGSGTRWVRRDRPILIRRLAPIQRRAPGLLEGPGPAEVPGEVVAIGLRNSSWKIAPGPCKSRGEGSRAGPRSAPDPAAAGR